MNTTTSDPDKVSRFLGESINRDLGLDEFIVV
jgi:hypothetical protein